MIFRDETMGYKTIHAIKCRQHSIYRDVDLYAVIECLKKYFTIEAGKYS